MANTFIVICPRTDKSFTRHSSKVDLTSFVDCHAGHAISRKAVSQEKNMRREAKRKEERREEKRKEKRKDGKGREKKRREEKIKKKRREKKSEKEKRNEHEADLKFYQPM